VQGALGLVADGRREACALEDRSVQAFFVEIRRLEALKENHVGMLTASWAGTTGIPWSRDTLRAAPAGGTVVPQESAEAGEVRLEGIEEREGFRGFHEIEIAAKTDGVLVEAASDVVHQLKARLAVKFWIAAVHSDSEGIR